MAMLAASVRLPTPSLLRILLTWFLMVFLLNCSWSEISSLVSPRAIKETFLPPTDYRYPFMAEE